MKRRRLSKNQRRSPAHNAFTLIELLCALALFMLLMCAAIYKPSRPLVHQCTSHVERLASTLRMLQARAIATHTPQTLTLTLADSSYAYGTGSESVTVVLPDILRFNVPRKTLGPPGKPRTPIRRACTFPRKNRLHTITCSPDGSLSSGTLYLTDTAGNHAWALSCGVQPRAPVRIYSLVKGKWARNA